jgi:prepilin-type N-terminal cleavage/methylation domain-containing protein
MLNAIAHARQRGFSLVEMMVALVLGLIVTGAVLALVVAIIHSNRQTLQSTRLNQELRATLAVIASDLRRARSVQDPLTTVALPGGNPYQAISASMPAPDAGCLLYGYDADEDKDGASESRWHILRRATAADGSSRVVLLSFSPDPPADCAAGGTEIPLGSDQVDITRLVVSPVTTAADAGVVREFTVTLTGQLIDGEAGLSGVERTMSQTVFVGCVGTGI